MDPELFAARRAASLQPVGSLRESLGELGALTPRNEPPHATGGSRMREWLRSAYRTIETLETVCCTMILCCSALARRRGAEQCARSDADTCS